MSYGIDPSGIRTLTNYKDASDWEAAVKPIRGSNPPLKPLGKRNKKHINIRREGDDILVRLYRTDVLTYKPDGSIIINTGGYHSQSTVSVIAAVLPWGPRPHLFKDRVWIYGNYVDANGEVHNGHFRIAKQATINLGDQLPPALSRWSRRTATIMDPDPVYTHHIDRKAKREAVKEYASFLTYIKGVVALRAEDGDITLGVNERVPHFRPQDLEAKMRSDDPADHYDAFLALPNWQRYWGPVATGYGVYTKVSSITRAVDRQIIRQNAERILIKTQAPWGKRVDDKYKNYV